MSGFKQTEIGTIPEDWEVREIKDLVLDTKTRNPQKEPTKKLKYIDVSSVSNQTFSVINYQDYLGKDAPGRARKVICTNDVIFATVRPTLKRVAKISQEFNGEYCSTAFCVLRADKNKIDFEFLYQYLLTNNFVKEISKHESGASYPAVRDDDVKKMKMPYPPLNEQGNIAKILSVIQSAIETQEKIIQTTTELKKALMHKLFTEGIKGERQKETEIGLVPESWEVKVFEDIVTLQRGKDLPKEKFVQGEFPVGGSNGIIGYHNQFNTKAPGVTVGRSGSCGKVVFYEKNFWAHNTALVVKDFHGNNEKFIYYFLFSLKLEKYKSGVSVPTLNRNAFRTIEMAIPKINEQIEIAKMLEQTDKKITIAIEKKSILQSLFKSMLHHLMTGQIRVKGVELRD